MRIKNKKTFHNYVLKQFPKEACGFVIDNMFVKCENISDEPEDNFTISREKTTEAFLTGNLQAVLHSHPVPLGTEPTRHDVRAPSKTDMETQEEMDIPWGIVTTEGENVTDILWFGCEKTPKLKGRTFIPNVFDCYTLVIDYYKINHNIEIRNYPREPEWEDYDPKMYDNNWIKEDFVKLERWDEIQPNDVLMFKVGRSTYVNHAAIMLDGVKFLHHLYGKLSCEETLNDQWRLRLAYVCRHKDFVK